MQKDQRRRSERIDLEVKVDLESDHTFYTGLTRNIGAGGLFVATYDLRPVGDRISLKFQLPGNAEPLEVETEVRWIREISSLQRHLTVGMGLSFINLPADVATAIGRFLTDRDSLYHDDE
jgi:uncharacterized protein (TIGR02266 family)